MKKYILVLSAILFSVIYLQAQEVIGLIDPAGFQPAAHVPFHQYLIQHKADFQRNTNGQRSTVYREISYEHDVAPAATWLSSDTGHFQYNAQALLTEADSFWHLVVDPVWHNLSKNIYTYDAAGNTLSSVYQYWDTLTSTYINQKKIADTYNSSNVRLTDTTAVWLTSSNAWRYIGLKVFTLNGANNRTQETDMAWDTLASMWVNTVKYSYYPESSNLLDTAVNQTWNTGSSSWVNSARDIFVRDMNHNATNVTYQTWTGGAWVNSANYLESYDLSNNRTQFIIQNWNSGSSMWVNSYKYDYTYDGNHDITSSIISIWNTGTSSWDNSSKDIYTYNGAYKMLSSIHQTWSSGAFVNSYERIYTYDINNNLTLYQPFNWINNAWAPTSQLVYSYDTNNNLIHEVAQQWDGGIPGYANFDQWFFYYQSFTVSGIGEEKNELNAVLYPNPSNGNINLSVNLTQNANLTIAVYDAMGRIVSEETRPATNGTNNLQLNYQEMASGNYMVQLIDRTNSKTSLLRFVKE